MSRPFKLLTLSLGLAFGLSLAACGEDAQLVARQVGDFIQNVQTGDGQARGTLVEGAAPDSTGAFTPSSNVGSATVLTGGSTPIIIGNDVAFATIIVLVAGSEGYYEIDLPSPTGTAEILLTLGQEVALTQFDVVYTVIDQQGQVGQYISTSVSTTEVPVGDIQVSVIWDAPSNIELAVAGPDGERISIDNRQGDNGATLHIDSNAGCVNDQIQSEAITYPRGQAPSGTYTVELRLADGCGTINSNWTATVLREGASQPIVRRGSFQSTEGGGESGVFSFTFSFPPQGGEPDPCPSGFVRDPESGDCVPADGPAAPAYHACGISGEPETCESPNRCLALSGLEAAAAPFCAPPCTANSCPSFEGTPAVCGLGEDGSQTPTRCVLVCNENPCPSGMRCQEVTGGSICVWPI